MDSGGKGRKFKDEKLRDCHGMSKNGSLLLGLRFFRKAGLKPNFISLIWAQQYGLVIVSDYYLHFFLLLVISVFSGVEFTY